MVAETTYELANGAEDTFEQLTRETLLPWYRDQQARPMIYGGNPLGSDANVVLLVAYPTITAWHEHARPVSGSALDVWQRRATFINHESTRLLMVNTEFGAPV